MNGRQRARGSLRPAAGRLVAVMVTAIVGYTSLIQADERSAVAKSDR